MDNFTNDKINKMGIYELRNFARNIGVVSPTSKKREQLIEEINNIKNGNQEPVFKKFGRPVKSFNYNRNVFTDFEFNGDNELKELIGPEKKDDRFIVFNQDFDESNIMLTSLTTEVNGILRKSEQGTFYMLNSLKLGTKLYVLFDEQTVAEKNLIVGDLVYGNAYVYSSKNYAKIHEIFKVNGKNFLQNTYNLERELQIPQNQLVSFSILQGQSRLCQIDGNINDSLDFINRHVKQLAQDGFKCVVLGLEISIETKLKLDRIDGITDVVSIVDDTTKFSIERIGDAINYVSSLFYHGEKVVFFVLDILGFYHILDLNFGTNGNYHSQQTELYLRKILGCNKSSKDCSISTLGLYYKEEESRFSTEIELLKKITNS